jgi:hypothetical protein
MKKRTAFAILIISVFLMTGCQSISKVSETGDLKAEISKKIPHLTNRIYVTKQGVSADKVIDELLDILVSSNHLTLMVDRERHIVATDTKDVGHSTLQRMTFVIEEKGDDAQIKITTQWRSGANAVGFAYPVSGYSLQEDWAPTQWEKNRLGIAMAESNTIANKFEKGIVSFDTDETELAWYNRKRDNQQYLALNNKKKDKKSDIALNNKKKDNKRKNRLEIANTETATGADQFNGGIVSNESEEFDSALYNKENKRNNGSDISFTEKAPAADEFNYGIVSNDIEQTNLALFK